MKQNQKIKLLSFAIIIVAAVSGFLLSQSYFKEKPQTFTALKVYPKLKTFSGFELTNKEGNTLKIDDFADDWTLIFFGFTYCPDICPTTLNQLQRIVKKLENAGVSKLPKVMLISVDPERDTPQRLKTYIDFFNPEFEAATGNHASLLSLSTQLGVAFHVEEHEEGQQNYDVNHTAAIFLVNPDKQLYGIFQTPHVDEEIFQDLNQLLNH